MKDLLKLPLIQRELKLFWLFTKTDITATIIPGSIFMLVTIISNHKIDSFDWPMKFFYGIIYFCLYIYQFDVLNQVNGIEEDKINKPYRPIPRGLLTINEAYIRYIVLSVSYLLFGMLLGVTSWTILWIVTTFLLCHIGFDKNWFTKNFLAMALGTLAQLGAAWTIISPLTIKALIIIISISVWAGLTVSIQDLRDVEGDRINKRYTLPIILGDNKARWLIISLFSLMSLSIPLLFFKLVNAALIGKLFFIVLGLLFLWHVCIIIRLYLYRKANNDHLTYEIYVLLYCAILSSSGFIFWL